MIQVASYEQAFIIKTNRKPIQSHQSKTVSLFKTYTQQPEFDRHLEHMFSYRGMQMSLVGEFGTFETFLCENDCLVKLILHNSPTTKIKNRS